MIDWTREGYREVGSREGKDGGVRVRGVEGVIGDRGKDERGMGGL